MDALLICFHQCNVLLFSSRIPSLGILDSSVCTFSFRTWCFLGINNSLPWSPLSSPKWDEPLGSINRNNLELYTLWTSDIEHQVGFGTCHAICSRHHSLSETKTPGVWAHWPHVSPAPVSPSPGGGGSQLTMSGHRWHRRLTSGWGRLAPSKVITEAVRGCRHKRGRWAQPYIAKQRTFLFIMDSPLTKELTL